MSEDHNLPLQGLSRDASSNTLATSMIKRRDRIVEDDAALSFAELDFKVMR